jgi:hypothetical protein
MAGHEGGQGTDSLRQTAPKEGDVYFFFDGHIYKKTQYRAEKALLTLPRRHATYVFNVVKGILSLRIAGEAPNRSGG